ncbi:MAG TPA: hypothetical protein PKA82_16560 [Pyrinomonadaceae bacterium]|nr:hypothetical protein [Pyrinomonadaceae bacterium]
MASNRFNQLNTSNGRSTSFILPIAVLWGVVMLLGFGLFWLEGGLSGSLSQYYLVPWAFVAGIVVLSPTVYLYFKGKFDLFHPLVFAAWSYIFPAFIIGALIVAFKLVDPYFLVFIEDPEYNLPLSLVYISIGFLALTIGYFLPLGRIAADAIEPRLPKWNWDPDKVWVAGLVLLFAGISVNIIGFLQGIMGYQRLTDYGTFDALLHFLVVLVTAGTMLLWLGVFGSKKRTGIFYISILVLILIIPFRVVLLGSRGSLLVSVYPIIMGFIYSGRKLSKKMTVVFGSIIAVAICIGIVYGTSFRNIKGSEESGASGDYVGQIGQTAEYLINEDPVVLIQNSSQALANRIENLSSVAVVVSNYERLAPYEASYGLDNNIINDTLTSFVPRFLWPDKPPTSDARAYSLLYFNYGENSFAISPFADLLRNFGPIGIPIGMLLLGIYLRLIYALLVETSSPALWKYVAYLPLLTLVSYEAFFATILPGIIRTIAVLAASLVLANLVIRMRVRK